MGGDVRRAVTWGQTDRGVRAALQDRCVAVSGLRNRERRGYHLGAGRWAHEGGLRAAVYCSEGIAEGGQQAAGANATLCDAAVVGATRSES